MLERAHANPTKKVPKRDIIDDHARYGTRGKMVEVCPPLGHAAEDESPTLVRVEANFANCGRDQGGA